MINDNLVFLSMRIKFHTTTSQARLTQMNAYKAHIYIL